VVATIPTVKANYEHEAPLIPVTRFLNQILYQIRTTSAFSVIFLHMMEELNTNPGFRKMVEKFCNDPDSHWENFFAVALSYHADGEFDRALEYYEKAKTCIENDSNVAQLPAWQERIQMLQQLKARAQKKESL
jgi:tetratricopeptide (TPR) repeat protein